MNYIAHIRESDKQVQTVEEHLLGVKKLAETYGEKIGIKHLAGLAGMLHDLGKYTNEFRTYILEAIANPLNPPKKGSVDHSTAGGKLLYTYFHERHNDKYQIIVAEIVGNAIISHHAYLQDYLNPALESNYLERVRDREIKGFELAQNQFFNRVMDKQDFHSYVKKAAQELENFLKDVRPKDIEMQLMFLTKFIFSTLIDADRTNTRLFEEGGDGDVLVETDTGVLFQSYYSRLLEKIDSFKEKEASNTLINLLRTEMSEQCDRFAEKASGVYTLSIPTGGGKTLASLRYALKHAQLFSKDRIIYVVPFTTIIEQNADEVRNILKDTSHILEHHSNVIYDEDENYNEFSNIQKKLKLAKDSWDSPIVFTTMVQFLNVFYSKGNRNVRRLHNLSNAVIIFDEVQKVPTTCVSLFNHALNFLKSKADASILLCTATQPALDFVENKLEMNTDAEIIENLDEVIHAFKRVEIIDKATDRKLNNNGLYEFIKDRLDEVDSILVILNTRTVVRNLYRLLKEQEGLNIPIYHLSTSMCAAHRNKILEEVKAHLKEGNKVICISTQLIETGVNVNFDCVIRSLAGLDSIAQAAGRCNRHGEHRIQKVYVIDHSEENLKHLKEIEIGKRLTRRILIDLKKNKDSHGGHLLSTQAMDRYFKEYYTALGKDLNYFIPELDKYMMELLTAPRTGSSYYWAYFSKHNAYPPLFLVNSYKTTADYFQVIENMATSVIVPYGEGEELIAELDGSLSIGGVSKLLRKAQKYTINLYTFELDKLMENSGVDSLLDGKIFVLKKWAYDAEFGLNIENGGSFGLSSG